MESLEPPAPGSTREMIFASGRHRGRQGQFVILVTPVFPETWKPFSGWLASPLGGQGGCRWLMSGQSRARTGKVTSSLCPGSRTSAPSVLCRLVARGGGGGGNIRAGIQSDPGSTVLGHCSPNTRRQQQEDVGVQP